MDNLLVAIRTARRYVSCALVLPDKITKADLERVEEQLIIIDDHIEYLIGCLADDGKW